MEKVGKILVLTDSLGLPRLTPEKVTFEETYFAKLRDNNEDLNVVQLSIGAATLPFLFSKTAYYLAYEPQLVFVHAGVVDCAPRAFRRFELDVLNKFRIKVPKSTLPFFRKYRALRHTSPKKFRTGIRNLQARFGKEKVYWIGIMPASDEWEAQVPGIKTSVKKYNTILQEELGDHLLAQDGQLDWLMSDHHHLNVVGHEEIFRRLEGVVRSNRRDRMEENGS